MNNACVWQARVVPRRDRRESRSTGVVTRSAAASITCRVGVSTRPITCSMRRERAKPVREVRELGAGDAGEKILRAAGEPGDFVRDDRAEDEDVVVGARARAAGSTAPARPRSSARPSARTFPRPSACRASSAPTDGPSDGRRRRRGAEVLAVAGADLRALLGVRHRRMRALRDERVEPRRRGARPAPATRSGTADRCCRRASCRESRRARARRPESRAARRARSAAAPRRRAHGVRRRRDAGARHPPLRNCTGSSLGASM